MLYYRTKDQPTWFADMIERGDIKTVLARLETRPEEVPRQMASRCLKRFMESATVEEYGKLLSLLPGGEYLGRCDFHPKWNLPKEWAVSQQVLRVQGTLVSLAVAFNRADILRLLLARGHDVNCASFSSAAAMIGAFSCAEFDNLHFCSTVRLRDQRRRAGPKTLKECEAVTPLALAVLMGHVDCARILLEHGAWMEQNPSVSWAMYIFWREEDEGYRAARDVVRSWGDLADHRPVLSAMTECSAEQLRTVLNTYSYGQEECAACIASTLRQCVVARKGMELCDKMLHLWEACPEMQLNAEAIAGIFRCSKLCDFSFESLRPMLRGRRLDVTGVNWRELSAVGLRKLLAELSAHCELVAEGENLFVWSKKKEELVLRYVTFAQEKEKSERTIRGKRREQRMDGMKIAASSLGDDFEVKSVLTTNEPVIWLRVRYESKVQNRKDGRVCCTELCAAALGGRDDVIRTLLEKPFGSPEEWENGRYSSWYIDVDNKWNGEERYLLNAPVAAAIGGHWDTVKLLLEKGASPHWEEPRIKELWQKLRGTDLAEEVRSHLGNEVLNNEK